MSKLDKEQVIEQFTKAYTSANGKAPTIEAKGGWYSIDGGKNVRLAALVELTNELTGSPAAAPAPVKKAPTKKVAPAKAKKNTKTSGFSVKDWWQENVLNTVPGSRPPR